MNFCSAKKGTLQSFLIKKWTQQSLGGTLYNCVLDPTKWYNRHYKTMDITNLSASMIQTWSCTHVWRLIQKQHSSQKVTQLPSSSQWRCRIKKFWQSSRLVDPQYSRAYASMLWTLQLPICNILLVRQNAWYITWLKVMVDIYVLHIFCSRIFSVPYIF